MSKYNFWLGISKEMQDDMVRVIRDDQPAVDFPMLEELNEETYAVFSQIYDSNAMERLFNTWQAQGRNYRVWNCYAIKPENVQGVRSDLDNLIAAYPLDFSLLGAWNVEDGRPVGMQWSEDDPPVLIGEPWYPTPPQTINFMPDVDEGVPATELTDVLLLLGQAKRNFVME